MIVLNEKVDLYLKRIGADVKEGDPLDGETLKKIQYAHVTAVPYENLDILDGIPLSYDYGRLFGKIVTGRRGGYCFELNGLYAWLLREMGFEVQEFMARYLRGETEIPMRRHRVLKVLAEGRYYLCDVGVGAVAPRYPIILEDGLEQPQFGETYKMRKDSFFGRVLTELHGGGWRDVFGFTEEPQLNIDYIMPSFYCEKHADSIFNKENMIAIKTETGRKTLDGNVFKIFEGENLVECRELRAGEINECLYSHFGIQK